MARRVQRDATMQIDRKQFRLLTSLLAVSGMAVVGCSSTPEPMESATTDDDEEEVSTVTQALPVGGDPWCPLKTTTTVSTSYILPPTICTGALGDVQLQRRASAVFSYLMGGEDPRIKYPCTEGGSLNMTSLNYIRSALAKGSETAKIGNCFFSTNAINCNSSIATSHHILRYSGTSLNVVNALKNLATNVNGCWYGAGTWAQPARPNNVQYYEGTGTHNPGGEDCRYKDAYVATTTKTIKDCQGNIVSQTTSYKVGCFRLDPGPSRLQNWSGNELVLTNGAGPGSDWSYSNEQNSGVLNYSYALSNVWQYDPYWTLPAGQPCVSKEFAEATGYYGSTWPFSWYVNNYIQKSGDWVRCATPLP